MNWQIIYFSWLRTFDLEIGLIFYIKSSATVTKAWMWVFKWKCLLLFHYSSTWPPRCLLRKHPLNQPCLPWTTDLTLFPLHIAAAPEVWGTTKAPGPAITDLFDSTFTEGQRGVPQGPHPSQRSSLCENEVFEARLPSWGGWFVPLYLNLPEACLCWLQTRRDR